MLAALRGLAILSLLCSGCVLDSVEPWLSEETIVETKVALDGAWTVVDEVELFGSERKVTLEHKPATPRNREYFYVTVRPVTRDTQFVFEATVHEIEGLRFLQISNFHHFDGDIIGLANRPTYSLWRVEFDADNLMLWMPELDGKSLKSLRDQDDKTIFVDSAANNEAAVRQWARAYRAAAERPRWVLALALTRKGTEFTVPLTAEPHMPKTRRQAKGTEDDG